MGAPTTFAGWMARARRWSEAERDRLNRADEQDGPFGCRRRMASLRASATRARRNAERCRLAAYAARDAR